MKLFLGMLVCVIAVGDAFAAPVEKTDRFDGSRTIFSASRPRLDENLHPVGMIVFVKESTIGHGSMSLMATEHGPWQYLECSLTKWLVDGVPVALPQPVHHGTTFRGGVVEQLQISPVPIDTLQKIGNAHKVEFQTCGKEFEFSPLEISDFREMVEASKRPSGAP